MVVADLCVSRPRPTSFPRSTKKRAEGTKTSQDPRMNPTKEPLSRSLKLRRRKR